jgi:uncharacterized hydrophobic protein (TIGR00271 family)
MNDDLIIFRKFIVLIRRWFEKKASLINHPAVIKDIYAEADISVGYFGILSFANLIALCGLITNSAPVIIGAMLISPLMGPILSFGFAFITGEEMAWKRSVKKIAVSVFITVVIAAMATYLSPLKDITSEIISRTRPNLYDLIIAFLSGIVGAVALCTKKNFLTIVPGVAIATAVIPPLSVTGFGIGVFNFRIAFGGFFLFFTNFVAIILATCIVFYMYGFRPSIITESDLSQLKRRATAFAAVLFLISIPLIYTLHKSISEVRLRNNIQNTLKKSLNRERRSSLSTFNYYQKKDGKLEVNAVVNTVNYMKEEEITAVEGRLNENLGSDVKLYLDQVKVQPGGLKKEAVTSLPTITPPRNPADVLKTSRESVISVVRQSSEKVEKIISPSTIADMYVGFHDKTFKVSIAMKIKKDAPLTEEEINWLKRMFAADLGIPVDLSIETVPFVPLLVFDKGEISLSDDMKTALSTVKDAYMKNSSIRVTVQTSPESAFSYTKRAGLAEQRAQAVKTVLTEEYKIPESAVTILINKKKTLKQPTVRVTLKIEQAGT